MSLETAKLFEVAQRIKTPLSLAGAALIVFYLLIKKLLSLDVFSNIGSAATADLLQALVVRLFWLAMVTIGLGVASYLVALILNHRIHARESKVELVDARLDPHSSDYEQTDEAGTKIIQPKKRHGRKEET